ncbi:MAG: O-antigen ligase family protein [Anaerolineae bacterium]
MNDRPRTWTLTCLVGLAACVLLTGVILGVKRGVVRESSTQSYTPVTGEADWHGGWELSELGADPSESGSIEGTDRVTLPFTGTQLALHVRRGGYRGYFWVDVDGKPANRLPHTKPGAYLSLTSPDYEPQTVTIPVAGGLDHGPHVAQIVADRGWDQWPLAGWRVEGGPDTLPYDRASTGLTAAAVACLIGAIGWAGRWAGQDRAEQKGQEEAKAPDRRLLSAIQEAVHPSSIVRSPFAFAVTAIVFYASPWLPLTVVCGVALAGLIVLRLDLGLALVGFSAPFYLHPRPLVGKSFSMAEIATLLCLASWGIRQISRFRAESLVFTLQAVSDLDLAVLFLVLVAAASTLFADYGHVALRELRVIILEPALFYMMLRTAELGEEAIWRVANAFAAGAVAVALVGLAQYALDVNTITAEQGFRRLRSVYGSPNNAALYLGRALPMLMAGAAFTAKRSARIGYGILAVPVGLAVLLTFSRGALLLGIPLSLLAMGMLAGARWRWTALGLIVVAAIGIVPLLSTPRFAGLLDPQSGTLFFRLRLWRASWQMLLDHPWLGVGPDNFLYQYRGRYVLPSAWQEPHLSHAHNFVLTYATRLGIPGLAAGIWLQIAFWRQALALRTFAHRNRRALMLGLTGSMVYTLAHGLVDASYFFVDLAFAFHLTLALVQSTVGRPSDGQTGEPQHGDLGADPDRRRGRRVCGRLVDSPGDEAPGRG